MNGFAQFPPDLRAKLERASANISRDMSPPDMARFGVAEAVTRTAAQAEAVRLVDGHGMKASTVARLTGQTYRAIDGRPRRGRRAARA